MKLPSPIGRVIAVARAGARVLRREGFFGLKRKIVRRLLRRPGIAYSEWVARYDTLTEDAARALFARLPLLRSRPLFSVVMPVYETNEGQLRRAIETVRAQVYPNWELCIADDASKSAHVRRVLDELAAADSRIRVVYRPHTGHISAATNSALELCRGDFVVLLDHDDELPAHALFRVAEELDAHPDAAIVYSDEDKIDEHGRRFNPYFKPDWNPDLFLSQNFVSHLGVYRRSLVQEAGGFREGFEGSQDYDLALRLSEKVDGSRIRHIPAVLYHWRATPGSTAHSTGAKGYAQSAAKRALQDHFARTSPGVVVEAGAAAFLYRARYPLSDPPLVTLIIVSRGKPRRLRACVESIRRTTDSPRYELLVVHDHSGGRAARAHLAELAKSGIATVIAAPQPFNASEMNNLAAKQARGELLCFLDDGIEPSNAGWLVEMASHAVRPEVGAVGAKLISPDGFVEHAGIFLGLGEHAVAGTPHKGVPAISVGHFGRAAVVQDFSAVSAACMVMRKQVFEAAGGFDAARFPVAFGDVDLCLRLGERGLRVLWTPYAELTHRDTVARASDRSQLRASFLAEATRLRERWGALLRADPHHNPNLSLEFDAFALAVPPRSPRPFEPLYPSR